VVEVAEPGADGPRVRLLASDTEVVAEMVRVAR
jgi:hypothetical protein